MIIVKTEDEIENIRKACGIAAEVLKMTGSIIEPGISTEEIEKFVDSEIKARGAKAAFKGYRGYKHASCLSVNEEVVHGIPGNRRLAEGDIIGVDIGAIVNGYYGDVARTFAVGKIAKTAKKLMRTTKECLDLAIKQARSGNYLGDISNAIEQHAKKHGYSVVKDLYGHGVGKSLHEDPLIPNFGKPGTGPKLEKGMTLAIEPMLNVGGSDIVTLEDGWTVVTRDKKLSAHYENTVLITDTDAEVLTRANK